jgi:cell division protein FtsZ
MRLMEVDEAANHIRELVDPDANIIWGSAFNNDLDGKIRVSVVATGIGAEEIMPIPQPAKVFTFPTRTMETPKAEPKAEAPTLPPITLTPPEPVAEPTLETLTAPEPMVMEAEAEPETMELAPEMMAGTDETEEMMLDQPAEESLEDGGDELLLDSVDLTDEEPAAAETAPETMAEPDMPATTGRRSWLTQEEPAAQPAPETRQTGTLFERMSNIARGAAKAQVDEETEEGPRMRAATRDPLDIPRFLNRQNNQ